MAAAIQQPQPVQQPAPPANGADAYPAPIGNVCMIQKGRPSNRCQKLITRQVNLAISSPPSTPEYLNWSEASITFSRADHPPRVPRPGHAALVLEAQIGGYEMSKVFMDGGSGINLIFASTLQAMSRSLTASSQGSLSSPWVKSPWTSSSANRITSGARRSTSK